VKFLSAVSGTNDLREGGSRHQVTKIMVHEQYDPADWYVNDIAVLRVETPFAFDANTAAVVLPEHNQQSAPGATATLVGWGLSVVCVCFLVFVFYFSTLES
jgi:secreted trypsin-like serine protease